MELKSKLSLDKLQDSENIAKLLKDEDLEEIGNRTVQSFEVDKQSRRRWETNMQDAMELALQITQAKTYPWPNAANVKFPLLTIAAMQFAARAYPSLVKAPDLVKYRVQGKDPDGQKAARALRISAHMSYQLLEQDESWEEDQDKAFLALPILGCVFKKSYYDSVKQHNCSKVVLPKNLYVHYYAASIEDAERKTELFSLYEREIKERELRGVFKEHDYGNAPQYPEREEDERQGLSAPFYDDDTPRVFLEQHCYLDLDGDGYKEPYVVTVDQATKKVARIVARIGDIVTEQSLAIKETQGRIDSLKQGMEGQEQQLAEGMRAGVEPTQQELSQVARTEQTIQVLQAEVESLAAEKPKVLRITPIEHYTKYSFIPSPDGGFYDLGFGALLGPLNDSVNTLINQLLDSGALQNGSSGFIGKGARIKGGKLRFSPYEWKRVDVAGGALRDNLVPLPINQPSNVLFQLLGLLINYSERVGSVTDAMMGENPGQNTPAYNMSAMLEQGLQVFNGVFKRVYRSFRSEIRKLYQLNSIYMDQEEYFAYQDADTKVLQVDYTADAKDLIPAADPNAFSNKEKQMKAQMIAERAQMSPGYDPIKVEQRYLESMDIPDVAEIFPLVPEMDQNGQETGGLTYKYPPQPDPELEIKKADMQRRTLEGKVRGEVDMITADSEIMVNKAKVMVMIAELEAKAQEEGNKVELEGLKLLLKEFEIQSKTLVEMAKLEKASETSDSGTD